MDGRSGVCENVDRLARAAPEKACLLRTPCTQTPEDEPRTLLAAAALAHFGLSLHVLSSGHPIEGSYILYVYSESLASGHGITYFKGGEHAEGATDFLWMMLLGAGSSSGWTWPSPRPHSIRAKGGRAP
ncbi:hypothetical protein [Sorangium sp. So ce1182]|uniref:hypothetical protein n=1 Tax=Sorangium sp. So ce1182 TaxID=3133334 RepID=UPI003F5DD6DB